MWYHDSIGRSHVSKKDRLAFLKEREAAMQKTERLLNMILYLLNHQRVTTQELASKFEVSKRTILRDIDTLTLAGIPVVAYQGMQGGFEIMEHYKMGEQLGNDQDYTIVKAAVQGLNSAFESKQIEKTYHKINALSHQEPHLILDFEVLKEQQDIHQTLEVLEKSIVNQKVIACTYQNAQNERTTKKIEPLALIYQWYAWYIIGYDIEKKAYRTYKVLRMHELHDTSKNFHQVHPSINEIMKKMKTKDQQEYYDIEVLCKAGCQLCTCEYLNGTKQELAKGEYIMRYHLPVHEALWKGTLLSYADEITILAPLAVKEELNRRCRAFLFQNGDS